METSVQQCVGDNIDLNIVASNQSTVYHAMGVIKVISSDLAKRQEELLATIPRRKTTVKEKTTALKVGEIFCPLFQKRK